MNIKGMKKNRLYSKNLGGCVDMQRSMVKKNKQTIHNEIKDREITKGGVDNCTPHMIKAWRYIAVENQEYNKITLITAHILVQW